MKNDVSAFISPVHDLNGQACALIRVEAPADFLRAGFTPQLTEELARALLQLKMELYREDVKNYTFQIKRDGEKIVLIPKYKK